MPKHELVRVSKYSAEQMFDMAADVASYQEFLPLVHASTVSDVIEDEAGVTRFKGRLEVRKQSLKIQEAFISDVVADKNAFTIISTSASGPIKRLKNIWQFVDLPDGGSKSKLTLDYEISNFALRMIMKASNAMVMEKLTEAFEKRARDLYG